MIPTPLPRFEILASQVGGIFDRFRRMLDDEFLFGAAVQVPQVAVIFDRADGCYLNFAEERLAIADLLALIAYRYGFEAVREIGHGGYAIVIGHRAAGGADGDARRVLRFVPEHHVRHVTAEARAARPFDVRLDDRGEPIRDPDFPLLLSDLFLMPRHTTRLIFTEASGETIMAGGYPASLHCQLLPQVRAFNDPALDRRMAERAGDILEAALATLGVSVADAHGGNGGALVGSDNQPLIRMINGRPAYIPVVLDYGYYAQIGARTLAEILVRHGVTPQTLHRHLRLSLSSLTPPVVALTEAIEQSGLGRSAFGRLLYTVDPPVLDPLIWIDYAQYQWRTVKERTYPPLLWRSRLRVYPEFDEVVFPQRIETYRFTL